MTRPRSTRFLGGNTKSESKKRVKKQLKRTYLGQFDLQHRQLLCWGDYKTAMVRFRATTAARKEGGRTTYNTRAAQNPTRTAARSHIVFVLVLALWRDGGSPNFFVRLLPPLA